MKNYDFLNLSPFEFEILSRDLLQAHLNIFLESFGEGRDNGIDLRCAESKNNEIIIQAKRYKDYRSLYSNLKKEKVLKINPVRYIITTSTSLTPDNKNKILELFDPFIKSTVDILGKEDINNLLNKYRKVEKDFYKLWLSSTDVLNEIINSQVINQTKFLQSEIHEKIKIYVQNQSFEEALKIIESNKYVIISGDPGIGKTTLAEMLVFHLLGQGVEEFIFLSDSIKDGFKLFDDNKSQVFLFDDFLGRNFLKQSIATNEERQILRFINKVEKSKNKILLFTTREYILNQAKLRFDLFDYDFSKCVLDVSKYTVFVKAQILYNHLNQNQIPFEYINEIIKQGYLSKIIKHQNYNPRIIASFSNSKLWEEHSISDFPKVLINLFDAPFLVWEHAYEYQISIQARVILDCLLLTGSEVEYNQLYRQVKTYQERNKGNFDVVINGIIFKSGLRELESSLISIEKKENETLVIKYKNPSIQDFLVNYLNKNHISKSHLLSSILYLKSSFNILTEKGDINSKLKIELTKNELTTLENIIILNYERLESNSKKPYYSNPSNDDFEVKKIYLIINFFDFKGGNYLNYLEDYFSQIIYSENIANDSIYEFVYLIEYFSTAFEYNLEKILINISGSFWKYEDLESLVKIKSLFPDQYEVFINNNEEIYLDVISQIAYELSKGESFDIDIINSDIECLESLNYDFNFDTSGEITELHRKIDDIKEKEDIKASEEMEYFERDYNYTGNFRRNNYSSQVSIGETSQPKNIRQISEDEMINNLFNSLK